MVPKACAAFWLFNNTGCLFRGRNQPVDFTGEQTVLEVQLRGTQDTMEVLAARERDAIYAR